MRYVLMAMIIVLFASRAFATGTDCETGAATALVATLAQQTNHARARKGAAPLQLDARLNRAAQRHACDLARRQVASHRGMTGSRPMARIRKAGFRACFSAENVAQGTTTVQHTIGAWSASPGHARNQQDPRAKAMGFGAAKGRDGRLYWVGLYATNCHDQRAAQNPTTGMRPFSW